MALTVSVIQSNYLPWRGYFDIIAHSDLFIVYDGVAYSKNSWRNRNRIIVPDGRVAWLTVPVRRAPLGTAINRIEVAGSDGWLRAHRRAIEMSYGSSPGYADVCYVVDRVLGDMGAIDERGRLLSHVNTWTLASACRVLGIKTAMLSDAEFGVPSELTGTARLLETLRRAGATRYISGPAGLNYFSRDDFERADIELVLWDYSGYPAYAQRWRERAGLAFEGAVSIVDVIASVGASAASWLTYGWREGRWEGLRTLRNVSIWEYPYV